MKTLLIIFCLCFSFSAFAEVQNPSIVVNLLDYLAKDYGGAVQDGKVISISEYAEQKEFSELVLKSARSIDAFKRDQTFAAGIVDLKKKIEAKASAAEVAIAARNLQAQAIRLAGIEVAPTFWPKLSEGAVLFQKNCTACHGDTGKGDGPASASLNPKPASFWDGGGKLESSPYQYFNTIRLGVPGTPMAPWPNFSDKQVWAIAFYVKSLGIDSVVGEKPTLDLKSVASLKDKELLDLLLGSELEKNRAIAQIRTYEPTETTSMSFLASARADIDESMKFYKNGDFDQATTLTLKAYLEGIEPIEAKIMANDASLVAKIESQMATFRNFLKPGSDQNQVQIRYEEIQKTLEEISSVITDEMMSPSLAFSAAFAIFLREGFEAVLIIITLLSVIKSTGVKKAAYWVHAGWGLALIVGVVTWFASAFVISMSGASRELTEGFISLFAVITLLYVGFWLHQKTEIGRWTKFVKETIARALEKKNLALLAGIAFMAVFREAFEVVLFLRVIWTDTSATGQSAIFAGIMLAFAIVFTFSFFTVKYSQKIPIKNLFSLSSMVMAILSVVLVGKAIHSFQEAGLVAAAELPIKIRFDLLGIYGTYQTVAAQIIILVFLFILWNKGAKPEEN